MKRTQVYVATDGTTFNTAAECKEHEDHSFLAQFVELTPDEILHAINRTDISLADAFERIGNMIAAKRRESGELKRKPAKSMADAEAAAQKAAE